ncbi:RNA polymerase factor sigma-54 [Sinanaerobacter chloroacetimidivorans]|uniref:RNA polymerase factor sigma-54 n=1 Tax=Sinanaerobacter chloroacetimidivorans TaxID=2818044 RepID=A0A8J7W4N4_9FIRM|nr:RNA polymerase factor sigma-54 [Sinanaerobacter chloroacetimidivorans]MBR0600261.1 RNA polymerase factor sigma-54 [Sinanaerobacter chloroacetimidivorans]
MRLGYDLTIEQSQKLVMTPELIQAIQILQFNTQELESYVEEQLLTNPILEMAPAAPQSTDSEQEKPSDDFRSKEEHEIDWAEHFKEKEYDDISYKQWEYNTEKNEYTYEQYVSSEITLTEHLLFQLQFAPLKKSCRQAGRYIIESLDENGYMTLTLDEISRELSLSKDKVELVLSAIQSFDPAGVGARNLKECLLIQLAHQGNEDPLITEVINHYLEDIAGNRLNNIAKALNVTVREVQEISDIIKGLEPKPGRQFGSSSDTRYIVPDVIVEKVDDEYIVTVNESSAPKLTISPYYQKMLIDSDKESNISKFLTGRLNSALWLIRSIEQRRQTIYNVVCAVVKYQIDFFEEGPKHLKTLTLKQIADEVGIHESTVSRSINGKYMQTPRGVFEIKYFFTSGVSGNSGEGIASESIKTIIKEIVDKEDPKAPLSDQTMVEMLAERGIDISRRTVAKYRDEMNLPSSSKRKRY